MKRSILLVSLLASVAACSSGGSGSSSSDPSPGAAATTSDSSSTSSTPTMDPVAPFAVSSTGTPAASTAAVVGTTYGGCYDPSVCGDPTTTGVVAQGSNASTVTLGTAANGDATVTLSVSEGGGNINHTFDLTANGVPYGSGATPMIEVPDTAAPPDANGNTFDLKVGGSAAGDGSLQYVSYGLWSAGSDDSGAYGAFAAGNKTTVNNMNILASNPSTATANYSGNVIGAAQLGGTNYTVSGSIAATANLAGANPGVTGSASLNVDTGYWTTASFNSTLSGANWNGSISSLAETAKTADATGNTATVTAPAMSGTIAGAFYGPNAENIGGVFNLSDGGTNNAVSAFAGHK
jgi:hypothetical protein